MIWFTADQHFGCDKLVENTRTEFSDCKQHDGHLMDRLNHHVQPNDRLVIVGDFCKTKPGRYRPRIKCKNIFFVLGNHDHEAKIRAVFGGNVRHQYMAKGTGENRFWCSHYPTCFWDRSHYGVYHCYGHIHYDSMREIMMDDAMPGRRSIDVGVDHAKDIFDEWSPWSERDILDVLDGAEGHDIIKKEDRWEKRDF